MGDVRLSPLDAILVIRNKEGIMAGDKIPTPIVDKNGKQTTVHKSVATVPSGRASALPVPNSSVSGEKSLEDLRSEWYSLAASKRRWSKPEKDVRERMESLFLFADNPGLSTREELPPSNVDFTRVRSYFSGMHFAKEALSDDEREVLIIAEAVIRKLDSESPNGYVN